VEGGRLVAVGQVQLEQSPGRAPRITVVVRALWTATEDGDVLSSWRPVTEHDGLAGVVDRLLAGLPSSRPDDPEASVTVLAKHLAERSRNTVAGLRGARHGLERLLAEEIRAGSNRELEETLADILELSIAASRARDEAREALREGLWTWRSDDDAYHAQRRLLEPNLPTRAADGEGSARSWFRTLDAGVRQCRQMEGQLGDETAVLHSLLNAASTIAVTRDARAQETFNLVAAVGGLLIGVPALVLTLYGATSVLPLQWSNYYVLAPLAVGGLAASVIAAFLPGRNRAGKMRRFLATLLALLLTLLLLLVAGGLVQPDDERVAPSPATTTESAERLP